MTYVFLCAGCNKPALSERNDALTCSPACRARAHRNGSIKWLHKFVRGMDGKRYDLPLFLREIALVKLFGKRADKMVQCRKGETKLQARKRWELAAFRKFVRELEAGQAEPKSTV